MATSDERQCRICLDGVEAEGELGRLISPCQCKGSMRYVHIKCLQKWRNTSTSQSAFFACQQCKYQYRFARTQVLGLAGNPIVIAGISGFMFTLIVMLASFVTTYFMDWFEEPSSDHGWSYFRFVSPFEVATDLISAAFRVLRDGDVAGILEDDYFPGEVPVREYFRSPSSPGLIMRLIRRFLLGLPLVGAVSLVHLLLSIRLLAPVQWVARYRASRRRNNNRDAAAMIVISLIVLGSLRALYKVYRLTEYYTKKVLAHAELAILEVN